MAAVYASLNKTWQETPRPTAHMNQCLWGLIDPFCYDVMRGKVGTKWRSYMKTSIFLCFMHKLHESTKVCMVSLISLFSAYFSPSYIITEKGP